MEKPRILLFIDFFGWAFHSIAEAIAFHLSDQYEFTILAAADAPQIDADAYDILHIFGADQTYHHLFPKGRAKILKGVYAHLWLKQDFAREDMYHHLNDADAITVPSDILYKDLEQLPIPMYMFPEGVDTGSFVPGPKRTGPLVAGWAGNPDNPIKNIHIIRQACDGICELNMATGSLTLREMVDFYQSIDVILCASDAEGCPRPVLEAMSCGKYPVSFPVGIVPEVVSGPDYGLIVNERTVEGMRRALQYCVQNIDQIRDGKKQADYIRANRQWQSTVQDIAHVYDDLLRMK